MSAETPADYGFPVAERPAGGTTVAAKLGERVREAEASGYRFTVRHQPAVELEEPDWVVCVDTPDGRTLFPGAVETTEAMAWKLALARLESELAGRAGRG